MIASSAAAAAAAASESSSSKSKDENIPPPSSEPTQSEDISCNNQQNIDPMQSFDDQISHYKDVIDENNLSISNPLNQSYYGNNEKIIGSVLAHENLYNFSSTIPIEVYEEIITQGHGRIDNGFLTDPTIQYYENKNINDNSINPFQETLYYLQGQQALNTFSYDCAIDNFTKALDIDPNNYTIYLDRAYAHLQNGEFDQSLNDYQVYTEQKSFISKGLDVLKDSADFCLGARTGLDKGVVSSGKQMVVFAAQAIKHPVKTYSDFVDAIQMISDLAKVNQWKTLREIIIPEVGELINEWEILSPREKGEKSGYIIGKYGADILIPGVAAKAISQGVNGAKELAVIAKNLQNTEKALVLEAL